VGFSVYFKVGLAIDGEWGILCVDKGVDMNEQEISHVEVIKGRALKRGSCSACSRQNSLTGFSDNSVVYDIRLGNTSVRVCEVCREELIKQLKARKNEPARDW